MAQNVDNIHSMSYIFIIGKKNLKKLKEEATEAAISKTKKIFPTDINFPCLTTLPFKNLTLGTISSKKIPQMPPNTLQGGLVYGNVRKVSF